jgi:hypothetical protein
MRPITRGEDLVLSSSTAKFQLLSGGICLACCRVPATSYVTYLCRDSLGSIPWSSGDRLRAIEAYSKLIATRHIEKSYLRVHHHLRIFAHEDNIFGVFELQWPEKQPFSPRNVFRIDDNHLLQLQQREY